jgi:hypothetical protein
MGHPGKQLRLRHDGKDNDRDRPAGQINRDSLPFLDLAGGQFMLMAVE